MAVLTFDLGLELWGCGRLFGLGSGLAWFKQGGIGSRYASQGTLQEGVGL